MTFFDLSLPIDRSKVRDYYFEGDVWKKIIQTLGVLVALSVVLNAAEVFAGLLPMHYVGVGMPYQMDTPELRHQTEFMRARERMFHRMHGDEAAWTVEQKAEYAALASLTEQYESRYAGLVQTADVVAMPPVPDTVRPAGPMQRPIEESNPMPEGVLAPAPGRREGQRQSLAGSR
jgi:hypothetical protein